MLGHVKAFPLLVLMLVNACKVRSSEGLNAAQHILAENMRTGGSCKFFLSFFLTVVCLFYEH